MSRASTTANGGERRAEQRRRSTAIALALGALVVIFYVATIVRLGPNAMNKPSPRPPAVLVPQPSGDKATAPVPVPECRKAGTC